MHFKRGEPDEDGKDVTKDLYIKPRSFMIFSGEVRYNWLHSINFAAPGIKKMARGVG